MTLLSEDIIDQRRAKFNMMYYVLDEYRVEEFVKNSSIMFGLKIVNMGMKMSNSFQAV